MGSSYKGADLFGSGAHRFFVGKASRRIVSLAALAQDLTQEGTLEFGNLEVRVFVRGRLESDTETGLWLLRDAIVAETDSAVGSGVLVDSHGHQWATMKLISFEETGAVARGRTLSVGYVAEFGRLSSG
ncbi:MAG: hypothetical protein ACWA5W_04015 [Phycisphaerales bacterium]